MNLWRISYNARHIGVFDSNMTPIVVRSWQLILKTQNCLNYQDFLFLLSQIIEQPHFAIQNKWKKKNMQYIVRNMVTHNYETHHMKKGLSTYLDSVVLD